MNSIPDILNWRSIWDIQVDMQKQNKIKNKQKNPANPGQVFNKNL